MYQPSDPADETPVYSHEPAGADTYKILLDKAKRNGFRVTVGYPDVHGRVVLVVRTKFIEFISLTVKLSELSVAARIIVDTFEEQKIWQ